LSVVVEKLGYTPFFLAFSATIQLTNFWIGFLEARNDILKLNGTPNG